MQGAITYDRDRKVKVLLGGTPVVDSPLQSAYAKFLNLNADQFTAVANGDRYDIGVAGRTIPYEGGVAQGAPGFVNFRDDHFRVTGPVDSLYLVEMYDASVTQRGILRLAENNERTDGEAVNASDPRVPPANSDPTKFWNGTSFVDPVSSKMRGSILWHNTPDTANVGTGILTHIPQDKMGATSDPVPFVDADGMGIQLVTDDYPTDNERCGYSTTQNFAMVEHSPRFYGKIKLPSTGHDGTAHTLAGKRVAIGYSAAAVPVGVDDMLDAGLAGVLMRYLGGTNWELTYNNAVTTSGSAVAVAAALDAVLTYDVKINYNGGTPQIEWSINGTPMTTITGTNVPPPGTKMRFTIRIETTEAKFQYMNSYYQHVECDK